MQLCPECKSDTIERTSSTALRVILCLVLIFIVPLGFFFAWLPFVFPHTFRCNNCNKEGNEKELKQVDWRERDSILSDERTLGRKLETIKDYWFEQMASLYKITEVNHMFVLVRVTESSVDALHIHDLKDNSFLVESLSPRLVPFKATEFDWEPTEFGEALFTDAEMKFIVSRDYRGLKDHLQHFNQLVQPFQVYEK